MNKKQLIFGALLGLPTLANADVNFSLSDLTIAAGETKTVTVNLDVTDATELSTYQMNIQLPEGLYFKDFDHITTETDYGWQLSRFQKAQQTYDGKNHPTKVMFVGMNLNGAEAKLKAGTDTKVAFTFDVVAASTFDPEDGIVKNIVVDDVKATDADRTTATPKYAIAGETTAVNGEAKATNGKVVGLYELNSDYNYMTLKDEALSEDISLTPTHSYKVTVGLVNGSHLDAWHNELNTKGLQIRGVEGIVTLPKGIVFDGKIKSVEKRTTGELVFFGEVEDVKDGEGNKIGEKRKFSVSSTEARIRNYDEYKDSLFTFMVKANGVEGENSFVEAEAQIVISDFVADVNDGGHHTWKFDTDNDKNILKINITNPDKDVKDDKDTEIGEQTDAAAADGSLWAKYNAQVEAVDPTVKNSSAVLDQEKAARDAIQALEHEVYEQYKAGTLAEWSATTACTELEEAAAAEIAKIATVAAETLTTAQANEAEAQKWIDNAEELDVPDFLNQFAEITPIKNERDENKGTLKDAKDALKAALQDSKDNGLLGDNKTSADVSLATLETAVQTENGKLKDAIEAAEAAKEVEDGKVKAAQDIEVPVLPDYDKEDDTAGTYATAKGVYNDALAALNAKFGTNGENGTVGTAGQAADLDIYKTEIEAVEAAITGLNTAITTVNGKAAANNAAAEQAKIDYALPTNVKQDDTQGTFAAAVKALDDAVAAAAEAGTQAKDDIYKDAIQGVKDAQKTVIDKGKANKALADAAIAEYGKYDYQNDQYDGVAIAELEALGIKYADIKENAEVKQAVANYEAAIQALKDQVDDVEDVGTEAKDDIYKQQLDDFYKYEQELKDKILAIADVAKANEIAAATALGTIVDTPDGTGKNDAYDDIKGSQDVKDAEQALTDAKQALTDAINEAKTQGTLGDTPSPLADEIAAVEKAVEDLAAEYEKQSEQAAENYDTAKAAAAAEADFSAVKAENLDDVNESKIVEDAKAEFEAAQKAVADQYQAMLDADKAGDATETETLNNLKQTLEDKLEAYDEAIATASKAIEEINEMTADVSELQESLTDTNSDSELVRAKVANPTEVTQEFGKLPTTQAQYDNLVAGLNKLATDTQKLIDDMKAEFKAGTKTQDQVEFWMENDLPGLIQAAQKKAVEDLVAYVSTVENGDVGGDGRWTSNDYARLRKVVLDEDYPEHAALTTEEDEFGELKYTGVDLDKLFDAEGNLLNTEEIYRLYRMDLNKDGYINVGDAQGALNYAFYGNITGPVAARANNGAEALTAQMNGNVIAVALQNARQYSAFQMDVVLPEGMTIVGQTLTSRNEGFSIAASELANGATRILVSATEAGKAFEGNEGDVLYIEVSGNGTVEFQNVIFADLSAGTTKFQLAAVGAETTGINSVNTQVAEGEQVYSLSGRVMNALKKGINIIRRADGTTQKVIKK